MKLKTKTEKNTDLFRAELAQMINLDHPLCDMAHEIDWDKADQIVLSWFEKAEGYPINYWSVFSKTDV